MSNDIRESKPSVDETTAPNAPSEEINDNASTREGDTSEKPSDELENAIDYKAELHKAREAKEKAEAALVRMKKQHKEEQPITKTTDSPHDTTPSVDIDAVLSKVSEIVEEKMSGIASAVLSDKVTLALEKITSNPDEQALTLHHYQNSIRHTGYDVVSITADLRAANAIANQPRLVRQNEEMKEALKSKATTSTTPSFRGQRVESKKQAQLSGADRVFSDGMDRFIKKSK